MNIRKYIKLPKEISNQDVIQYFKKWNMIDFFKEHSKTYLKKKNSKELSSLSISSFPYEPELNDLYKLHASIILNKRLTVLEFGSGWSSLVLAHALQVNKNRLFNKTLKLRKKNKFEIHSLENDKKFLNISKKRVKKHLGDNSVSYFHFSECKMTKFNDRICTEYEKLPLINPDFIYLDGPDQQKIKNKINGITTNHEDMMPMVCDILKIENFLIPGTIIIADGRTANSIFLKNNFTRNWLYFFDKKNDHNIFFLNDNSLGPVNDEQKKFYLGA
jgi:hypothetical protein